MSENKKRITDSKISCENALRKNKITFAEYNAIIDILFELWKDTSSKCETIMSGVSEFFKNEDFNVKEKGVGWVISFM